MILVGLSIVPTTMGHPAWYGSAWAETFHAFAPLGVLYGRYVEYTFQGTELRVPEGVDIACERTGWFLSEIQISLLTQTAPRVTPARTEVVQMRADLASFCGFHEEVLTALRQAGTPARELLRDAAAQGLFSGIRHLQERLQHVLERAIDALESEQETYFFGVAFALHTLRLQLGWNLLSSDLRAILHGSLDAQEPPGFLPDRVQAMVEDLVSWVDVPLDVETKPTLDRLVEQVYRAVLDLSKEWGEGRRTEGSAFPG